MLSLAYRWLRACSTRGLHRSDWRAVLLSGAKYSRGVHWHGKARRGLSMRLHSRGRRRRTCTA